MFACAAPLREAGRAQLPVAALDSVSIAACGSWRILPGASYGPYPPNLPHSTPALCAGEAAAESFVPRPDLALEEMRLLEVDVRTFAQGKQLGRKSAWLPNRQVVARTRACLGSSSASCIACERTRPLSVQVQLTHQLLVSFPPAGKGVQHPGSYLGVAERAAHIRAVGANAVVLTPSYATAKGEVGQAQRFMCVRSCTPG